MKGGRFWNSHSHANLATAVTQIIPLSPPQEQEGFNNQLFRRGPHFSTHLSPFGNSIRRLYKLYRNVEDSSHQLTFPCYFILSIVAFLFALWKRYNISIEYSETDHLEVASVEQDSKIRHQVYSLLAYCDTDPGIGSNNFLT